MEKLNFERLGKELGIRFRNVSNLRAAFIHRSFLNESNEKESNERLEFLGDAVLELSVTEFLFGKFPDKPEGDMTAIRAALVRKENLAATARRLRLGEYLLLSRGEESSGGRDKDYILANTVEALIGSIHLEAGYDEADRFISKNVLVVIDDILRQNLHIDAKSSFQELAQAKVSITPVYKLLKEEGPDHAKTFVMGAFLEDEKVGEGEGASKQMAEGAAARDAIEKKGWD